MAERQGLIQASDGCHLPLGVVKTVNATGPHPNSLLKIGSDPLAGLASPPVFVEWQMTNDKISHRRRGTSSHGRNQRGYIKEEALQPVVESRCAAQRSTLRLKVEYGTTDGNLHRADFGLKTPCHGAT